MTPESNKRSRSDVELSDRYQKLVLNPDAIPSDLRIYLQAIFPIMMIETYSKTQGVDINVELEKQKHHDRLKNNKQMRDSLLSFDKRPTDETDILKDIALAIARLGMIPGGVIFAGIHFQISDRGIEVTDLTQTPGAGD